MQGYLQKEKKRIGLDQQTRKGTDMEKIFNNAEPIGDLDAPHGLRLMTDTHEKIVVWRKAGTDMPSEVQIADFDFAPNEEVLSSLFVLINGEFRSLEFVAIHASEAMFELGQEWLKEQRAEERHAAELSSIEATGRI